MLQQCEELVDATQRGRWYLPDGVNSTVGWKGGMVQRKPLGWRNGTCQVNWTHYFGGKIGMEAGNAKASNLISLSTMLAKYYDQFRLRFWCRYVVQYCLLFIWGIPFQKETMIWVHIFVWTIIEKKFTLQCFCWDMSLYSANRITMQCLCPW